MSLLRQSTVLQNQLLAAIPRAEYELLRLPSEIVRLQRNQTLYGMGDRVRYSYFPLGGIISLQATTEDGRRVEIFTVGKEGFVCASVLPELFVSPYEARVIISCQAVRTRADKLAEEFKRARSLHAELLRYMHTLLRQVSQTVACINFHPAEARLCRWLLLGRERTEADTLHLTQELLSSVLGVSRTSVTAIAGKLQRQGLIRYSRGKITVLDRRGLAAASCSCRELTFGQVRRSHVA